MTDYVDSISNYELPDQKANFAADDTITARPQDTIIGANSPEFQPTPGLDPQSAMGHTPVLDDNRATRNVLGSGNLVAGGLHAGPSRTPSIKGLPSNFDAQRADQQQP
jgi:hypothetical protein